MFEPEHEIWRFAYAGGELDDWLSYAGDLIEKWATQDAREVVFGSTWEIILASLLLMDGLLPDSARKAYCGLMLETIGEVENRKVAIPALKISPPPPGRKQMDSREKGVIIFGVSDLLKAGVSKSEAYEAIGREHFKSPDTIRRMYERALKRHLEARKKKDTGK